MATALDPSIIERVRYGTAPRVPLNNTERLREWDRKRAGVRTMQFNPNFRFPWHFTPPHTRGNHS